MANDRRDRPKRKCASTIRQGPRKGQPCPNWAKHGATCCHAHLRNPQARANAEVRAAVDQWTVGDVVDDPGETLLRLVTQSRRRADALARELFELVEQHGGSLQRAMIGDSMIVGAKGRPIKAGEYVRGLAMLEAQERDRCANFAKLAVAAGLAEREVRIAERQGELINQLLEAVLGDLGLSDDQIDRVPDLIERHLELVAS